jgi:hypothetical protein
MKILKQISVVLLIVNLTIFFVGIDVTFHICKRSGVKNVTVYSKSGCSCDKMMKSTTKGEIKHDAGCSAQKNSSTSDINNNSTISKIKTKSCCAEYSERFKITEEFNVSGITNIDNIAPLTVELMPAFDILCNYHDIIITDNEFYNDTSPTSEIIKYINHFSSDKSEDSNLS